MGTTVSPIWDINNPIGTEALGTMPIWNPSNPVGTDTLNSSTINPNNPVTVPNSGLFGWGSNPKLAEALKGLGGGAGKGAGAAGDIKPTMPGTGGGGAGVGRPTAVSLTALLQMLNQRRDALLQSATGGVGAGAPQGARPTAGLLGF